MAPFVRPLSVVTPQDVAGLPLKRVPQGPVPVLRGPWEDADVQRPLRPLSQSTTFLRSSKPLKGGL